MAKHEKSSTYLKLKFKIMENLNTVELKDINCQLIKLVQLSIDNRRKNFIIIGLIVCFLIMFFLLLIKSYLGGYH